MPSGPPTFFGGPVPVGPRILPGLLPFGATVTPPTPAPLPNLIFGATGRLYQFPAGGSGVIPYFVKQPAENYPVAFNYAGQLPVGTSIASGVLSAIDLSTGDDASDVVLASTTPIIGGTLVSARVQAGTSGIEYQLTFRVTLNDSSVLEDDMVMKVVEY